MKGGGRGQNWLLILCEKFQELNAKMVQDLQYNNWAVQGGVKGTVVLCNLVEFSPFCIQEQVLKRGELHWDRSAAISSHGEGFSLFP